MNFHFKNGGKNEFKDNNEKSCSFSRNRVSHKIDLEAVLTHMSNATAWELRNILCYLWLIRYKFLPPQLQLNSLP